MKLVRFLNPIKKDSIGELYQLDRQYRDTLPIWKLILWRIGTILIKFGTTPAGYWYESTREKAPVEGKYNNKAPGNKKIQSKLGNSA